jgi:predicted RNA polymerase sigma factor
VDRNVRDDVLRLLFTACHPVLTQEARVTLTLRVVGGLSTEEIARAFLTTEPAIAQRVVRAKRALGEARVPFEVPRGPDLRARLPSVLEVLYLVFNEGHTATVGVELIRPDLTNEALRLAQLLSELLPGEPEAHALLALMRLHASRAPSRVDERGRPRPPGGAGPDPVGHGSHHRGPRCARARPRRRPPRRVRTSCRR